MARFRRVAQLWNWLPAFRGVAEHRGIHKASVALGTSPSALSRTVKVLEEAVGTQLFVRRATTMDLTEEGTLLLTATRNAMRMIDDALLECNRNASEVLRLSVTSPTAASGIALAMADETVKLSRVHVASMQDDGDSMLDALVRGDLDLIVTPSVDRTGELCAERIGEVQFGVYGDPSHPLGNGEGEPWNLESTTLATLRFAIRDGDDGWPIEIERNVVAASASLEGILALVLGSDIVTYLPDALVERLFRRVLVRLGAGATQTLYALRRKPLEGQDTRSLDAILVAVRNALGAT